MVNKYIYIAQMQWCEREEPICAGHNKKKTISKALEMLKKEYGTKFVDRGQSFCCEKITINDIKITKIPLVPIA